MELKNLLNSIVANKGYRLESPWFWDKSALGAIVPIIRMENDKRSYVAIEEVEDKVKITDTGKIDSMEIQNDSGKTVFLRGGNMLQGKTQTRAVQFGIILEPNIKTKETDMPVEKPKIEVPVRCVYRSKGISAGSEVKLFDQAYAGNKVYGALSRGQSETWNCASRTTKDMGETVMNYCASANFNSNSDDIGGYTKEMTQMEEFKKEVLDKIQACPILKDQVGVIIFTEKGLTGFEFFDHPDTWRAIHLKVLTSHVSDLAKKQEKAVWKLDKDSIKPSIEEYIAMIDYEKAISQTKGNKWGTFLIDVPATLTEYTWLEDTIIHAISIKKDKRDKSDQKDDPMNLFRTINNGDDIAPNPNDNIVDSKSTWTTNIDNNSGTYTV